VHRHTPSILQSAKYDLDVVATFLLKLIVLDGFLALLSTWDAGAYSFVSLSFFEPISIILTIHE
jgi:hypothetical protein